MIQAIIFDLDGTLVDSNEYHVAAWDRAFRHFGKEFSPEQLRKQIGKGADQYLPEFLEGDEVHTLGPKIDKYRSELYKNEYLPRVLPFPGVRELFERVKREGKKIALASSGKTTEVRAYKNKAGIDGLVDCETSADDVNKSKPAPDIFAASLEKLGNPPPGNVIAVGDTPYDVESAKKIGIATIAFLCGGFTAQTLSGAGAIEIYRNPSHLLARYQDSAIGLR